MTAPTRPTLLLIDNDPDILNLLQFALAQEPVDVVTCRTPEEGLAVMAERPVNCVLLDVHIARTPECYGFLTALRGRPGQAPVPVVATSAMISQEVVRHVLDLGARTFIPKPYYPRDLVRELRAAVA